MFNSAGVGIFASRGTCSPAFSPIQYPLPFRCRAAVLRTLRVKRCHTAHDECRDCHHHKEANRLEFSGHNLTLKKHKRFHVAMVPPRLVNFSEVAPVLGFFGNLLAAADVKGGCFRLYRIRWPRPSPLRNPSDRMVPAAPTQITPS